VKNPRGEVHRDFIGGTGLGVRILYEHLKPKTDPLGPDNILGFVTGPLTGTLFLERKVYGGTKSPLTGAGQTRIPGGSGSHVEVGWL